MSQPPTPFARSWSFTDFSTNNPTTPHQGQKIDLELNNVLAVLNYTISRLNEVQADDGKVRNSGLNFTTIAAAIGPILSVSIINSINSAGTTQVAAVNAAGTTQVSAVNAAGATFAATASTVSTNAAAAASSATTAEGWKNSAQTSALSATNSANTAFVHKNTALAYANDAFTHSDNAASSAAAASFSLSGCISSAGQASYEAGQANAYSTQAETSKIGALNAQSAAQSASSSASSSAISATASAVSATASASSASASAASAYNYYSAFNLSVGTVSTGAAGSQAVVTRTGTAPSYLLNFTIPAGAAGATGASGVIAATSPLAYNSGTQTVSIDLSAYATKASPVFTGTPTLPTGTIAVTQSAGNSTTAIATTAFVTAVDILKAPLASPVFTGDARCVTPATSDNDTSIATTAFVKAQGYATSASVSATYQPIGSMGSYLPKSGGLMTGSITSNGTTHDTEMSGDFFGIQLSADHTKGSMLNFDGLDTYDGASHVHVNPTGITFPDATVQTTSALPLGGGNLTGGITISTAGFTTAISGPNIAFDGGLLISQEEGHIDGFNINLPASGTIANCGTIYFSDSTVQTTAPVSYDVKKGIANTCAGCMYINSGYINFNGGVALALFSSSKFNGGGQYRLGWTNGGGYAGTFSLSTATNIFGDVYANTGTGYLSLSGERLAYSEDYGSTWTYSDFTF